MTRRHGTSAGLEIVVAVSTARRACRPAQHACLWLGAGSDHLSPGARRLDGIARVPMSRQRPLNRSIALSGIIDRSSLPAHHRRVRLRLVRARELGRSCCVVRHRHAHGSQPRARGAVAPECRAMTSSARRVGRGLAGRACVSHNAVRHDRWHAQSADPLGYLIDWRGRTSRRQRC